ncbi:MAG: hypothetical protein SGJ27_16030 [Candidatus Melainabacteria bacterium]|nr:hypothetical protein [Candidatus Melainabacteria bacterium]
MSNSLTEILDEIKISATNIETLGKRMQEQPDANASSLHGHMAQQISFFPMFLNQQIKMITELDKNFGDEFQGKCIEEVKEIADTAKAVEAAAEVAINSVESDEFEQMERVQVLFKATSKLNILQQRIAGKMMKSKRSNV